MAMVCMHASILILLYQYHRNRRDGMPTPARVLLFQYYVNLIGYLPEHGDGKVLGISIIYSTMRCHNYGSRVQVSSGRGLSSDHSIGVRIGYL